jgi:hypothetical protein
MGAAQLVIDSGNQITQTGDYFSRLMAIVLRFKNLRGLTIMLTIERLKELLHYDPDTGMFTWRVNKGPFLAGDVAGRTVKTGKYWRVGIDGKRYIASRLAWLYMTGVWPSYDIDHINRDRQDNRFCNLRDVTTSQNCFNTGKRSHNTTGYQGVYRDTRIINRGGYKYNVKRKRPEYFSQIRINGVQTYLGHSDKIGCAGLYAVAKELFCLPQVRVK